MPLLRNATTALLAVLSLTACNSNYPEPKRTGVAITDYYHDVTNAILTETIIKDSYYGQECSMSISLNRQGKVTDINNVEGFTPLCEAGMTAVFSAEIPAPPDEKTYTTFKKLVIVFQPQRT
ncbi:cell envelope biogenesis protein TolA [Serratia plymuthica]|uniref:cell envelope integrity TolA C-terminal domain-containing protein n=1 Tax=Serratia plymuthica TaxID=82996 RepID=UPI0004566AE2|nr:cell envelope integrity TolA C-terminal domain-containing protein [Serratia plymuthica]AHY06782.1 Tol-Pal system TolA [Serratia plymuthica]MBL3521994.1 cell envelope biogenesis protein TolA [Serratia plymuthica]MEB6537517.1 cell envelope biogenesis protein TolA [Serratia plymuthica]